MSNILRDRLQHHGLYETTIQWNDNKRALNSCWGPRIVDWFKETREGKILKVIRPPNFTDPCMTLPAKGVALVADGVSITLETFLKNIGTLIPGLGNESLNLYNSDMDSKRGVILRTQAVVLPKNSSEFVPTANSYAAINGDPANIIFAASASCGISAMFDAPGNQRVYLQKKLPNGNIVNTFYRATPSIAADPSVTRAYVGPESVGQRANVVLFGQIPLMQKPTPRTPDQFGNLYGCCEREVIYRSFGDADVVYGDEVGAFGGFDHTVKVARDETTPIALTLCYYFFEHEHGGIAINDIDDLASLLRRPASDKTVEWCGSLVTGVSDQTMLPNGVPMKKSVAPHTVEPLTWETMPNYLRKMGATPLGAGFPSTQ